MIKLCLEALDDGPICSGIARRQERCQLFYKKIGERGMGEQKKDLQTAISKAIYPPQSNVVPLQSEATGM